ncbi:MAG TPA: sigma-70 family RNA polymerase sigma factor [Polyangiaceae bacterium]|jgi:RNA polymerase sigma-70 factor (ECF subfamily)|nr:sigma-70 family RNA polymerase sigma factor [Polyangiaceae bacterium]
MATEAEGDFVRAALARYREPLLRFAASMVGPSQAADVVQDTFLALCKAERADVEAHLTPWLFRVCKNRALDLLRERKRVEALSEDEDVESPESGPSSSVERKQSMSRVQKIMEGLPKKQREALLLKFSAGLSYKEISEVMDLTITNVGVILHTAIKTVRERLEREAEPAGARSAL